MVFYRLLVSLLAAIEVSRRLTHRDWAGVRARLGRTPPSDTENRIWLHAASNGELASVKPIIEGLAQNGWRLLVTTNTDTGVALAQSWNLASVHACLAPLDLSRATLRLYQRWHISAHIAVESELWPHRILACPGPVIVLGARLTERTAKSWRKFDRIARRMIEKVDFLSAQDPASLARFTDFGLKPKATGPVCDLKGFYKPPADTPDATLTSVFPRADTWLAASTHPGEDEIVLDAHKIARQRCPDLKLILAPRHPKRADEILKIIAARGLTVAQRSLGEDPSAAQVYLADTLGDMHLWYALAGTTFVAGSLKDRGGHTPYEPAYFESALIHGPDIANFKAAYSRLSAQNAAICVTDASSLARAVITLADAKNQAEKGRAAQAALKQDADLAALMRSVNAALTA